MEELRIRLKNIVDANENIRRRATQMMSFIGIIIAASAGLGLNSVLSADLQTLLGQFMAVWLGISMALQGSALVGYQTVIRSSAAMVPIISRDLMHICDDKPRLSDTYKELTSKKREAYYDFMSMRYLESISDNERINKKMARNFNRTLLLFTSGVFAYTGWAFLSITL